MEILIRMKNHSVKIIEAIRVVLDTPKKVITIKSYNPRTNTIETEEYNKEDVLFVWYQGEKIKF